MRLDLSHLVLHTLRNLLITIPPLAGGDVEMCNIVTAFKSILATVIGAHDHQDFICGALTTKLQGPEITALLIALLSPQSP